MAAPKWQPSKLYMPGAIVVPRANTPSISLPALTNGSFETGDGTDWTIDAGMEVSTNRPYTGSYSLRIDGILGTLYAIHDPAPAAPGMRVTATCMYNQGGASRGDNVGCVILRWYDADMGLIREDEGSLVSSSNNNTYHQSSITASAPAGTRYVAVGGKVVRNDTNSANFDNFSWRTDSAPPEGLVYKAVQPEAGLSASSEPAWPAVLGQQVIDNEVTWEAMVATRITYEASPILVSGSTEPTWPDDFGAEVADGTISWEAVSRHIEDAKCPHSKVVTIIASKVFAADKDIVAFCATANPLDWGSEKDAGYLPTGLEQANSNQMAVLAPYRSNLMAFNANCMQNWQVDPDPEAMAILDQMDGIGSTWPKAAQAVGNELFYLAAIGVRTVGIAGASTNLQAGDVGMPVDPMVAPYIALATANDALVLATYYPAAGQYWLAFPDIEEDGVTPVFVYSMTETGKVGAWTRYEFPFSVESFAQLGDDLYIKHGAHISRVSDAVNTDEVPDGAGGTTAQNFPGLVQWAYLDFGSPGVTKMLKGFDYVGLGQGPKISVGYDQRNLSAFTEPYQIDPDTLPGGIIPLPVSAPTFSVKLEFDGGESWRVQAVRLELDDMRGQP